MRILHLVARSQRRGAEIVALELARQLDALGHENRVVALERAFDGIDVAAIPALTSRSDGGFATLVRASRALRRDLARAPVDVVLAHGGRAVEAAAFARRGRRPALVWQRILGFPPQIWQPGRRAAWQFVARRVDAVVALTAELGDEVRRLGFSGPVWTIPNFRDAETFVNVDREAASRELRRALALDEATPLIGWVGQLTEQKRPAYALDVLRAVHEQGVDAHLVVAGDGPLRASFAREVAARGLEREVHMLGARDDVGCIFGAIDVFILTSKYEGVPGVLIEAQMSGCPVVAVPVGGVRAVVDDGETGIVTAGDDPGEVAAGVLALLADPARRSEFGAQARRRAARFSARSAAENYASRLAALLDR